MNDRIRELAEQADGVVINKMMTGARQYTFLEDDLEKFAELIVRECINEVEGLQVSDWNQNWNQAIAHTALHLKEHFGVEE